MQALPGQRSRPRFVPGDGLLHPVAIGAIALLIVNDHYLKAAYPGLITGKLSDFAGLAFFPLLIQAIWEVASASLGRLRVADRRVSLAALAATGFAFGAIKIMPDANALAGGILGSLQWIVGLTSVSTTIHGRILVDPADLVALPSLLVAYAIGARRSATLT